MPDRQNPYLFPPVIAPPRTLNDVLAAGSASFGHSVGTFSGLSRPASPLRCPVRTFGPEDAEQAFSHAGSPTRPGLSALRRAEPPLCSQRRHATPASPLQSGLRRARNGRLRL